MSTHPADPGPNREHTLPSAQDSACFLRSAAAYKALDATCPPVETIETHMSWVFLVGEHVLKLKKPVRFPYLDFSTLDAREFHCREELRLNLRLAPDVYLGLLALQWRDGKLALVPEGRLTPGGRTLDWLVLMRRLPAARTLASMAAEGRASGAEVDALVGVLSRFYRNQPSIAIDPREYRERFQREQASNCEVLLRPQFSLRGAAPALAGLDRALEHCDTLLRERAANGRIVEGHGDLRPEHVFLLSPPVVIDCIEFNAALRQVDPFDELSFLALECAMNGAAWIGTRLVDACAAALGDAPPPALLQLYTAYRALLRARLAIAHLLDPQPRTPARWAPLAERYVDRCLQALDALGAGSLVTAARSRGSP